MLLKNHKILLIQSRSFGDAIIFSSLINSLGMSYPNCELHLLARPQYQSLFKDNPFIKSVEYIEMPFGTFKSNVIKSLFNLLIFLLKYRCKQFDVTINLYPDFREEIILHLINSKGKFNIQYSNKHPLSISFRKNIFTRIGFTKIIIPDNLLNIYSIHKYIGDYFGCKEFVSPNIFITNYTNKKDIIGIHPFAGGQQCKMLEFEKWTKVILQLENVYIFCSPYEKEIALEHFGHILNQNKQLIIGSLETFFEKLSECKLLIGLDSFSIHAANMLNVPSIVILGTNDERIWTPLQNSKVIRGRHNCPHYPCYNIPKCKNTSYEFICMKSIQSSDILNSINL
jgi:heptosyltransferase-3